jgi:hypothetical protein
MKKYFLQKGTNYEGPFDFEELKLKNISKETYVWCEGLTEWTKAGKLKELIILFNTPPFGLNIKSSIHSPIENKIQNIESTKNSKIIKISLIISTILLTIILFYFLIFT